MSFRYCGNTQCHTHLADAPLRIADTHRVCPRLHRRSDLGRPARHSAGRQLRPGVRDMASRAPPPSAPASLTPWPRATRRWCGSSTGSAARCTTGVPADRRGGEGDRLPLADRGDRHHHLRRSAAGALAGVTCRFVQNCTLSQISAAWRPFANARLCNETNRTTNPWIFSFKTLFQNRVLRQAASETLLRRGSGP
jgi:hypothetical protein